MTRKNLSSITKLALVGAAVAVTGSTQANLVVNGGFESTSNGPDKQFDLYTSATGWTSASGNGFDPAYSFIFAPGSADTTGATSEYAEQLTLWGPNNGVNNGLIPGMSYNLSFYWATAQQSGFDGDTTGQWQVSLGTETHTTAVVNNPNHGFSGWMQANLGFTATSSSEVLSFFAIGSPEGLPPFVLLDGVNLEAVPEPGTLSIIGLGLVGFAGAMRKRRQA